MISELLPGFRALVAKKLMEDHGLSQTEVAELLDTTQPAISQYRRQLRGRKTAVFMKNHELLDFLDRVAQRIATGKIRPDQTGLEFCRVCKFMRDRDIVSGVSLC